MSRTSVMKYIARVINQVAISIILYDGLCCLLFGFLKDLTSDGLRAKRWWCFFFIEIWFLKTLQITAAVTGAGIAEV